MHNSVAKLYNSKVDWMAHLTALAQSTCDKGCNGIWLKFAIDVLHKNKINPFVFAYALWAVMKNGQGKHHHIGLVAQKDCSKTILLDPLTKVSIETFCSLTSSIFNWIGLDTVQGIFLNDVRWKPLWKKGGIIKWDTLLRLLEGAQVNLAAPINSDANISNSVQISQSFLLVWMSFTFLWHIQMSCKYLAIRW